MGLRIWENWTRQFLPRRFSVSEVTQQLSQLSPSWSPRLKAAVSLTISAIRSPKSVLHHAEWNDTIISTSVTQCLATALVHPSPENSSINRTIHRAKWPCCNHLDLSSQPYLPYPPIFILPGHLIQPTKLHFLEHGTTYMSQWDPHPPAPPN